MGGGAFLNAHACGQPTLNIQRMSREDYSRLKALHKDLLSNIFAVDKVVSLIEAPEKQDYGDIDFLIATEDVPDWKHVANMIGAKGLIDRGGPNAHLCSLAVRLDGTAQASGVVTYVDNTGSHIAGTHVASSSRLTEEVYAQVDLQIIPSHLFEWHVFYSSYSDMAGLLGHIVTHLGFTVSDKGLLLRMPELDDSKTNTHVNIPDRDGMVLLSRDPCRVMPFLGLSVDKFYAGFATLEGFYAWLGNCRLLSALALRPQGNKSSVRQRERKRTVYSRFFNEWIPAHLPPKITNGIHDTIGGASEADAATQRSRLRETLLHEALDFFGKRAEYEARHSALVCKRDNETAAFLLRPVLGQLSGRGDKYVTRVLRAFRRYVGFRSSRPVVLEDPHEDHESELRHFLDETGQSLQSRGELMEWVAQHWGEIKSLDRH